MVAKRTVTRRLGSIGLAVACLGAAGVTTWSLFGNRQDSHAGLATGEITASIEAPAKALGPSGLPIPRFVSLKAEKVNVRRGPSSDHGVAWVYQRKGLPVEIVAEFDNWRRVRDSDGDEGWILQSLLSGKRTALVAPWRAGQTLPIYDRANTAGGIVAKVSAGVLADIEGCTGDWCEISAGGYDGWLEQTQLWGAYPGESVD
jgi:SH3-like domain-containing protein